MKKNKGLLLLTAIVLLTTCLFAGLASAIEVKDVANMILVFPATDAAWSINKTSESFDIDLGTKYYVAGKNVIEVKAAEQNSTKGMALPAETAPVINFMGYHIYNDASISTSDTSYELKADQYYKFTSSNTSVLKVDDTAAKAVVGTTGAKLTVVDNNITSNTTVNLTIVQVEADGSAVAGAYSRTVALNFKINPIKKITLNSNVKDDTITLAADAKTFKYFNKDKKKTYIIDPTGWTIAGTDEEVVDALHLRDLVTTVIEPLKGTYNDLDDLAVTIVDPDGVVGEYFVEQKTPTQVHSNWGYIRSFKKAGKFTVKVTDEFHGSNVSAEYSFTVKQAAPTYTTNPVVAVEFTTNPIILKVGDSFTIDQFVQRYIQFTLKDKTKLLDLSDIDDNLFASADPTVVSVTKWVGHVEALKLGETTLKVKVTNRDKEKTTAEGTVTIKVVSDEADAVLLPKDEYTLSMNKHLTENVKAAYWGDPADLAYTSSDEKVFTVSATGDLTAVGEGTGFVTVTSKTNDKITATAKVTVSIDALEGIDVYEFSTDKKVEAVTLSFTATSNDDYSEEYPVYMKTNPLLAYTKSVTWTSSNPKAAVVQTIRHQAVVGGNENYYYATIIPTGAGTADITVTATDGTNTFSKTVKVTVVSDGSPVPTEPTGKILIKELQTAKSISLKVGHKKQISVKRIPSNATNKELKFKSNKTSVVTVGSNGKLYAKKKGTATITVSATDGSGVKVKVKVKVK